MKAIKATLLFLCLAPLNSIARADEASISGRLDSLFEVVGVDKAQAEKTVRLEKEARVEQRQLFKEKVVVTGCGGTLLLLGLALGDFLRSRARRRKVAIFAEKTNPFSVQHFEASHADFIQTIRNLR